MEENNVVEIIKLCVMIPAAGEIKCCLRGGMSGINAQRSRPLLSLIKMQGSKSPVSQPKAFFSSCRYRLRKRAELDSLEEELHGLEGQNRELRDKAESVEREIQYVKDLLIEVYKARSQRLKQDGSA